MSGQSSSNVLFGLNFQPRSHCLIILGLLAILHQSHSDRKNCGGAINDALKMMCGDGGFNTYRINDKRSIPSEDDGDFMNDLIDDKDVALAELNAFQFWKNMPEDILSLAKLRRRRNNGIFYECCMKPCTSQELMTYCRKH